MKFRVGACALLVCLAGCSAGPNTDFAELRGAAATKSATAQLPKLQLDRAAAKSIANAPDRGALVSYQNKGAPTKREGAYTFYPVAISEDHALKALVTGEMSMPMPDGSQVKLKYERHDESPDGNWTWVGRVVGGDPQQEAIITFGEKAVFASIPQPDGAPPLSIQTRNGALFAVQTDPSKVKSPNKGHNDMLVPAALVLRKAAAAQAQTSNTQVSQGAIAQAAPPTAANTVDVAIGYTAGYRAVYGSQSAVVTRLAFLIQVGNQAYSNSVINGYLRLVNSTEVAYTDSNSNQTALHELTGSNGSAPSNVAVPASLTPLRTARDQNGADIAILLRDFQQPEQQGCGIAWLIGANQQEIVPATDASWAYAVVSDGDDVGSDGHSYFCAPETLVHEASHLMGSAHDVGNSPNTSGRYPYSYGYKTTNGNFFTVMAYGDEGQTPYRVFSNPNITFCDGHTCGVANQADNARSLNQTIPVVTQFRQTVVALPYIRGDVNGDLRADIQWYQQSTGILNVWLMQGSSISGNYIYRAAPSCTPRIFGDFNGDAQSDVVLTCQNDNRVYSWLSSTAGYNQTVIGNFGSDWQLVAAADINGDRTDDFIWRQVSGSSTNINIWYMRAGSVLSSATKTISSICTVSTTGDLNGDGAADIIFMCADAGVHAWFGGGSNLSQVRLGGYGSGWAIVGSGDVNSDGKSDLIWHQASTGVANVWLMNSTVVASFFNQTMPTDCQPKAVNDYDGDGRTDVAWMCSSDRSVHNWMSAGSSFVRHHVGFYSGDWTIVR